MQCNRSRKLKRYVRRSFMGGVVIVFLSALLLSELLPERHTLPDPTTVAGHHAFIKMYERIEQEKDMARLMASAEASEEDGPALEETDFEKKLREAVPLHQNKPWFGLCEAYGATTVQQFRFVVHQDPLLRKQYADFDWPRAHVVKAPKTQALNVMYRQGGALWWTQSKITIHKDEPLITDGKRTVRSFCCNEIHKVPLGKTLPEYEPQPKWLQPETFKTPDVRPDNHPQIAHRDILPTPENLPLPTSEILPITTPQTLPIATSEGRSVDQIVFLPNDFIPVAPLPSIIVVEKPQPSPGPVTVPEPSVTALLGMALVVVGWIARRYT